MQNFCPACGAFSGNFEVECFNCGARELDGNTDEFDGKNNQAPNSCVHCASRVVQLIDAEAEWAEAPWEAKPRWGDWLVRPIPWPLFDENTGLGHRLGFLVWPAYSRRITAGNAFVRGAVPKLVRLAHELQQMHICLTCGRLQELESGGPEDFWAENLTTRDACHTGRGVFEFARVFHYHRVSIKDFFEPKVIPTGEPGSYNLAMRDARNKYLE